MMSLSYVLNAVGAGVETGFGGENFVDRKDSEKFAFSFHLIATFIQELLLLSRHKLSRIGLFSPNFRLAPDVFVNDGRHRRRHRVDPMLVFRSRSQRPICAHL